MVGQPQAVSQTRSLGQSIRIGIGAAVVVIVAVVAFIVYKNVTSGPSAPTFTYAKVARGTLNLAVTATGPISAVDSLPLTFKQSGRLLQVLVQPGQQVKQGDVLAREDPTDFQHAADQAKATLAQQQANLDRVKTGPTPEQLTTAQQVIDTAQSNLKNAQANVDLVQQQNAKDIQTAQVAVDNAQKASDDAEANVALVQQQVDKANQVDQVAITNAQAALTSAQASLKSAQSVAGAGNAADQVAIQNATTAVADAQKNVVAAQQQQAAAAAADQTAVQTAQIALANAQANVQNTQAIVASGTPVQQQQLVQAKNALYATQVTRDAACNLNNHLNSSEGCAAANATVNTSQSAIDSLNAQILQAQAQAQATLATAQQAVTTAQQGLTTAQDAATSDAAKQKAAVATAQQAADTATAQLKAAQSTLANDNAKLQASVVASQAAVVQANSAEKSAEALAASDAAKGAGTVQTAQQAADAQSALLKTSQAALDSASTKAASALHSAQASVDSDQQAVTTGQDALAQLKAPATQADIEAAQAAQASAAAAYAVAQDNLAATTLVSPIDGTVAQVNGTAGQDLTGGAIPSNSTGFILLDNLRAMQVVAQVNETNMANVKVGNKVTFNVDAFPGQSLQGQVTIIQPLAVTQQNVVNYLVTSTFDPTTVKILPGMTAAVHIVTASRTNVLVVPNTALVYGDAQYSRAVADGTPVPGQPTSANAPTPDAVVVNKNGVQTVQVVTIGVSDGSVTEILSGLNEGDQVVLGIGSVPLPGPGISAATAATTAK